MIPTSPTILLADDESHLLHAFAHALRSAGYSVLTARTGPEALSLATRCQPDLLITDYSLPQLSGLELAQKLHGAPATAALPTILLTAPGYALSAETPAKSGIRRLMPKPLSPRHLLTTVHQVLDRAA